MKQTGKKDIVTGHGLATIGKKSELKLWKMQIQKGVKSAKLLLKITERRMHPKLLFTMKTMFLIKIIGFITWFEKVSSEEKRANK